MDAGSPGEDRRPWKREATSVTVKDVYEAEIVAVDGDEFIIVFYDADMEPVDARLPGSAFRLFEAQPQPGMAFGIVLYHERDCPEPRISAWPTEDEWDESQRH
jgi:hypothetical protein